MATPHTVPPSHCTAATPVSFPRPGLTHLSLPQGLCACSSPSLELCLSPDLPRTRSSSSPRSPPKRHGQGVNPCPRKPPVFPSCRVTFCNVTLFYVTLDMSKRTVCVCFTVCPPARECTLHKAKHVLFLGSLMPRIRGSIKIQGPAQGTPLSKSSC